MQTGFAHLVLCSTAFYKDALPLDSNGSTIANRPATMNKAPEIYIGTLVVKSAYSATIGA
jgi:hypothetical protein